MMGSTLKMMGFAERKLAVCFRRKRRCVPEKTVIFVFSKLTNDGFLLKTMIFVQILRSFLLKKDDLLLKNDDLRTHCRHSNRPPRGLRFGAFLPLSLHSPSFCIHFSFVSPSFCLILAHFGSCFGGNRQSHFWMLVTEGAKDWVVFPAQVGNKACKK